MSVKDDNEIGSSIKIERRLISTQSVTQVNQTHRNALSESLQDLQESRVAGNIFLVRTCDSILPLSVGKRY